MTLNRNKFQNLEKRVMKTLEGKTPLMEVPYYVCLYEPKDELEVLESFTQMGIRLKNRGYSFEVMKLSGMMIEILSNNGLLSIDILNREEENREDLEKDLRDILLEGITNALRQRLGDKPVSHGATLLRYGALYPFVHLSNILNGIEAVVQCTLVIPYPSDIGMGYPLNKYSGDILGDYRAEAFDLR